jgi:hypothetical protein
MPSKDLVFADRLVGISVHNGLVRLNLGVVAGAARGKDDKPAVKLETTHQLVLPLDGFIAAVAMQEKLVKELVERSKKRRDAKGESADAAVTKQ